VKRALLIVLVYVLAMIQLGVRAYVPDLLLLLVLTVAVFEDRNFALVVGLLAGAFLDAGNPNLLGSNMIIYLLIAYGVTRVRRMFYERVLYMLVFGALALVIKYGLTYALTTTLPLQWHVAVSCGLTLALLVPVYRLVKTLFRYQWKVA